MTFMDVIAHPTIIFDLSTQSVGELHPDLINGNETIAQAMVREAKEEAGIQIDLQDLQVVHTMHRTSDVEYIDFFLTAEKWEGEPTNKEPEKADDMQWFPLTHLPKNTLPYIRQALDCFANKKTFSEMV